MGYLLSFIYQSQTDSKDQNKSRNKLESKLAPFYFHLFMYFSFRERNIYYLTFFSPGFSSITCGTKVNPAGLFVYNHQS